MKKQVLSQILVWLLVFVIVFFGCKKEDPITPVEPPIVVPVKLALSLSAAPALQSDQITVLYGGTATINASANIIGSTITSSTAPDQVFTNTATFNLSLLTTNQTVTITTKNGSNIDSKTVTLKITPPTADELMIFGKYKESEAWGYDYDYTKSPLKLEWKQIKSVYFDNPKGSIYTFGIDKSLFVERPGATSVTSTWSIKMINGERILTGGVGAQLLEEVTNDYFKTRVRVTDLEFTAGLRENTTVYTKVR